MLAESDLDQLVGMELPAGTYTIDPVVSQMLASAVLAPPRSEPHPIYAFVAAQTGIGITVADLLARFGSRGEDGPMLGECSLEMHRPFEPGVEYRVTGAVIAAARKRGRALGVFDLITFALMVRDPHGELVSTCEETFVLPRRGQM